MLLLACIAEPARSVGGGDADADDEEPEAVGGDAADDEEEEEEPSLPGACSDIYDAALLPEFHLAIADEEWARFAEDYAVWTERAARDEEVKPWHVAESFSYADETWTDVRVRLKGNPCCSWVGNKYQFVISFNEVDKDARMHGVRAIALDAPYYEPSVLHERLSASWQADLGLPSLCVNNARLYVNDEYFGLYANVEVPDEEFLQRQFGDEGSEGNLYKYDYTWGDWEQKEGDGDWSDLQALYQMQLWEDFEAIAEVETNIAFWAADAVMPNADGYWVGSINFMIYHHPTRGWLTLPWDQDATFWAGTTEYDPTGRTDYYGLTLPLDQLLREHPERYWEAVAATILRYDDEVLRDRAMTWSAQIRDAVAEDPNRYFSQTDHVNAVADLLRFPELRRGYLDEWAEAGR